MDIFAHALYGATVCSRTGLAGGGRRERDINAVSPVQSPSRSMSWGADWTVWCAALFGVLPDGISLVLPSLPYWLAGTPHLFFGNVDSQVIILYRYMHSLIVALVAVGLIRLAWKPMFIPSLAWVLHICMDALMHGSGTFQTTLFYPLSTWSLNGIRWWEHPNLVLAYWLILPVIWLGIYMQRRRPR